MKLIDLLFFLSDSTNVIVFDTEGKELARYDGRDSIPEVLNNRSIVQISVEENWMLIVVAE